MFCWLKKLLEADTAQNEPLSELEAEHAPIDAQWCVVANVVHERRYGEAHEPRSGTKHFASGAKVYVVQFYWGMGGESVTVVGRHRKSKRYMQVVMQAKHLANWRAQLVYSPHIIRHLLQHQSGLQTPATTEESRQRVEEIVASYLRQGAAFQPFLTRPPQS